MTMIADTKLSYRCLGQFSAVLFNLKWFCLKVCCCYVIVLASTHLGGSGNLRWLEAIMGAIDTNTGAWKKKLEKILYYFCKIASLGLERFLVRSSVFFEERSSGSSKFGF